MTILKLHPTSVEDAVRTLENLALKQEDTVFRGHKGVSWRLDSTLKRHTTRPHAEWDTYIDEMLSHFQLNLRAIGKDFPFPGLARRDRLEYGRHYGIPSPLIDFSLSPYVAMFFAFNGIRPLEAKEGEEAVIYALDIKQLAVLWAKHCAR